MRGKACIPLILIFMLLTSLFLRGNTYAHLLNQESRLNLIANGDFKNGIEGWKIHNQGEYEQWAGLADFSIENGELKVEIKQEGWAWWHIQLYQEPVSVNAGTYRISFDMRADVERTIYAELTGSGTARLNFVADGTMKTYEAIIEVPADGSYKFMFGLGREPDAEMLNTPYNIFIDNVKLIKVVEEPLEAGESGEHDEGREVGESERGDESVENGEGEGSDKGGKPEESGRNSETGESGESVGHEESDPKGENESEEKNEDIPKDKEKEIVKTGSFLDFRILVTFGVLSSLVGVALLLRGKLRYRRPAI